MINFTPLNQANNTPQPTNKGSINFTPLNAKTSTNKNGFVTGEPSQIHQSFMQKIGSSIIDPLKGGTQNVKDVAIGAGGKDFDLPSDGRCRRLNFLDKGLNNNWRFGIDDYRKTLTARQ